MFYDENASPLPSSLKPFSEVSNTAQKRCTEAPIHFPLSDSGSKAAAYKIQDMQMEILPKVLIYFLMIYL